MQLTNKDVELKLNLGDNYYSIYEGPTEGIDAEARIKIDKIVGDSQRSVYVNRVQYAMEGVPPRCRYCDGSARRRGTTEERWVWYADMNGIAIVVGFEAGRWQCRHCGRSWNDYPRGIRRYMRHSVCLLHEMVERMGRQSIKSVCRRYNIEYRTLVRLLREEITLEIDWGRLSQQEEIHLVIDEHSFRKHDYVLTIVEGVSGTVLALLEDDKKATLKQFLATIPEKVKHKVQVGATDMRESYWRVLKEWKSDIAMCADPFHVVQSVTKKLNQERCFMQSENKPERLPSLPLRKGNERLTQRQRLKLAEVCAKYPTIKWLYDIKEAVREMYKESDLHLASQRFEWCMQLIEEGITRRELLGIHSELRTIRRTMKNWQERILNYFIYHRSTAQVEGQHTTIKMLKRQSYGFKRKDIYRIKMMLGLPTMLKVHMRLCG